MDETIQKPQMETLETLPPASETFFNRLVGINEAATISRASKGQLSKDTNAGKLPYELNDKSQKRYKVSDLYQRYGFRDQKETSSNGAKIPAEETTETMPQAVELAVLQERVRAQAETIQRIEREKAETLHRMEQEIQDLRQSRDRLIDQNNRLTLLLPAPPASKEPEQPQELGKRLSIWKRLFS